MATVLVVDDNPITLRLLTFQLCRRGHQVVTAHSSKEALRFLHNLDVDIAIIDLAMPRTDGLTILHQIRSNSEYQELPVIILATGGLQQDRIRANAAGADAFMAKPADPWRLSSLIGDLLIAKQPLAA